MGSASEGVEEAEHQGCYTTDIAFKRFSIANSYCYYCGSAELSDERFGFHIPDAMNGLWRPPIRIARSFEISEDGISLSPFAMEMFADHAVFHFRHFNLKVSIPPGTVLTVEFEGLEDHALFILHLDPMLIWLSEGELKWKAEEFDGGILLNFEQPRLNFLILAENGSLTLSGKDVLLHARKGAALKIRDTSQINGQNGRLQKLLSSTVFHSENKKLEQVLYWSKLNLHWLYHIQEGVGNGITAGHPDFPWFFGFDTMLCIDAMLSVGMWEEARESIETLSRYARAQNGQVPHEIVTNGRIYNPGDLEESALYPAALHSYLLWTGDRAFVSEHMSDAFSALRYVYSSEFVGRGAVEDRDRGKGIEVDTVAFFLMGVRSFVEMSKTLDFKCDRLSELMEATDVAEKLLDSMWLPSESLYANRIIDGKPLFLGFWNSIAPFVAGVAQRRRFSEFVSSSKGGLKHISSEEGILNDRRTGAVMPVNNGLMSLAAWRYGNDAVASRFYNLNLQAFGKYMPCAMPEIVNRRDGCYLQAWSAAMIITPLLRGALGLHIADGVKVAPMAKSLFNELSIERLRVRECTFSLDFSSDGFSVRRTS
jgi:hypothetical protein